jgi:hypothetical protein
VLDFLLTIKSPNNSRKRKHHDADDEAVDGNSEQKRKAFFVDKLREYFASPHFLADLAYLCDIFSCLNELNLKLIRKYLL